MADDSQDVAKVQVKFKTQLAQYKVTEKPFQVPVNLNRRGLSQVINHLLGSTAKPVPFDFLIENEFLRVTLEKYMKEHNRSFEEIITIEYVELLDTPTPSSSATHSDWIAAIDNRLLELHSSLKATGSNLLVISYGAYDAQIGCLVGDQGAKQFGEDAKPWSIGSHSQPVLSVSSYFRGKNIFDLASCSQDSSVLVRRVEADKQESKITHKLEGHEGAVEHVEFDPTGKLLATCAWDDTIKVWDLNDAQATKTHISGAPASSNGNEMDVTEKKKSNKRSKVAESKSGSDEVALIPARSTLVGHNQCVSTLQWISADQLVSGSWDHSLRFWDVESGVCTKHFDGNKVILSLDHSELNGLVATGHADKTVRTWDPRVSFETSSLSTAYTSHTGWVSAVSWHPTNANLLISASFDTSIKVWDLRSTTPLHTMPSQHQDKVTTLAWLDADTFVSGGADKFVRTYSFPNTPSSE